MIFSFKIMFRDTFTAQLNPDLLEFGHIMEHPFGWEERYERKDSKNQRHQGKVQKRSKLPFCYNTIKSTKPPFVFRSPSLTFV